MCSESCLANVNARRASSLYTLYRHYVRVLCIWYLVALTVVLTPKEGGTWLRAGGVSGICNKQCWPDFVFIWAIKCFFRTKLSRIVSPLGQYCLLCLIAHGVCSLVLMEPEADMKNSQLNWSENNCPYLKCDLPIQEGCVPLQVPSYWQYLLVEPTRIRGGKHEKETEER